MTERQSLNLFLYLLDTKSNVRERERNRLNHEERNCFISVFARLLRKTQFASNQPTSLNVLLAEISIGVLGFGDVCAPAKISRKNLPLLSPAYYRWLMMSCRVALILESLTKLCNWQEGRKGTGKNNNNNIQILIRTHIGFHTVCNATQATKQTLTGWKQMQWEFH